MNHQERLNAMRPNDNLDYQRLIDVTGDVEMEAHQGDPKRPLGRRFDYDTALKYGARRTDQVAETLRLENPDDEALLEMLGSSWMEGFVFGALAYTQEHRGRGAEPFLDRVALANINHGLALADTEGRSAIFSSVISTEALSFVAGGRSINAAVILRQQFSAVNHQAVKMMVAAHWLDGFLTGLVFEELGGHREGE